MSTLTEPPPEQMTRDPWQGGALQLASAVIPALSMAYLALVVLPEIRTVESSIRGERMEIERRAEESKAARARIATEQALLLVDLEESRKLAKHLCTMLKNAGE